jgi:DNA helicase-2/ATP-dependent DNA helicase PcrA
MIKVRLSDTQRQVVEHGEGALLVVAGPGSGKTRVLTERVRRLLTNVPGHFRVLALTFTNKAANEMTDRLSDLGEVRQRAFIGTLHGFCLDVLADRGKLVGVESMPQIFEQYQDRKQILLQAIAEDPLLTEELSNLDSKASNQRVDEWLKGIATLKAHPISYADYTEPLLDRIYDGYNAGLRACGAYDFEDLLALTYQLFTDFPKVADFYRRLYKFICIDEAQDLNEAQYAVLRALCGSEFKNVLMVGDPKQSIYGFNTSSPEYMQSFKTDFDAIEVELLENYRSSKAIVRIAQSLDSQYLVEAQLPIEGKAGIVIGDDEDDEAKRVVDIIELLQKVGHPDVEGPILPSSCAILGRTRFVLLAVEKELKSRGVPFFKRLSATYENESKIIDEFQLVLRVYANPRDVLHLNALAKKWECSMKLLPSEASSKDIVSLVVNVAATHNDPRCNAIANAILAIDQNAQRLDLMPGFQVLENFADGCDENSRRAIREDVAVLREEWDQYLRSDNSSSRTVAGFMSSIALGNTGKVNKEGVALLTVHSSKGLEFDVVFMVGMADGVFPDYRAKGKSKQMEEEKRNAFVAITRSKRLLFLSFPRQRTMPWGDVKRQTPSEYIKAADSAL